MGKSHRIDDCAIDANITKSECRCATDESRFDAGEFSRMGAAARQGGFAGGGAGGVEAVHHYFFEGFEGAGAGGLPGECAGVLA